MRKVLLRLLALAGLAAVVAALVAVEAAHDRQRVDEAGVVLVGLTCAGVLLLSYASWRRAGALAFAGPVAVPAAAPALRPSAPARSGTAAIEMEGVVVRFGERVALNGLSLRVHKGEVVGLLGPNGAGKTTAVDVCCGLRRPDAGRAAILGRDAANGGADLRRLIGAVPQESGLYAELTAFEHLRLFASMYGTPAERIEEVLTLVGLWDRRDGRVATYSGGMKRRLALARALLHDPPVLFLDEPTLGVDVHGRRALWDHVERLREDGRSVLLTTNYLEEATALCDRVVIIDEGNVLADESPETLRRQGGATLVVATPDTTAVAAAVARAVPVEPAVDGGTVRIPLPRDEIAAAAVNAASAAGTVTAIRTEEPSLEEVFLRLTGRGLRE
ncbi:MAG TPA: ABC transporter ATP-binding protein [Mycobacteriales bacterium]|jgi:ABC-type multidrug transport system ATPase subunit